MANAQELTIANEVTDIGQTSYRIPVVADYEVTNTGNKPLVIDNVEVSCGCVKVDYPKQPIQEGGKAHIRATFDAAQLGHFTKQLLVYSNACTPYLQRNCSVFGTRFKRNLYFKDW